MNAERYASRKWIACAVVVLACIILFTLGKMTEGAFVDVLKWTLGLYFAANVAQKATNKDSP